jgi:hypothetical protein
VGFVIETARWRCPDHVAVLQVSDLDLLLPLALVWRRDNLSPLLSHFVEVVRNLSTARSMTRVADSQHLS